jgi:signal transduction histidine kinase
MRPTTEATRSKRIRALSNAIDAGVLLVAADKGLVYASDAALELLCCASANELDEKWPNVVRRLEAVAPGAFADPAHVSVSTDFRVGDRARRVRWQFKRGAPDAPGTCMILLHDLEVAEARDEKMQLAARYLCFARLYRAASHDLRDPLNTVALHLELLKGSKLADGGDREGAQRALLGLTRDFRAFTATFETFLRHSQPADDARSSFDARDVLHEVADALTPIAREQRVSLDAHTPSFAVTVAGRRARLKQALALVAIHAIDAMPDGGTLGLELESDASTIRIVVSAGASPDGARAELDAADFGPRVARSIVEEHGGTVDFDRTTARLELPVSDEDV